MHVLRKNSSITQIAEIKDDILRQMAAFQKVINLLLARKVIKF